MTAATERPRSKRVHTPTVIQMEAVECGAAALGIVLGYFGRIVPLEELRLACGVSRDGSKAVNVVKAARAYGLEPRAYRKEPSELAALPLPAILFWEFNHFLVLEGFGPGRVYLNDPASGPRTVTDEEFDRSFTGVVITFTPGPEFTRGGARPSLVAALRARLAGSGAGLAFAFIAGLCLVVPGLLVPTYTRIFIDRVLVGGLREWLPAVLLAMGVTLLALGALTWLQQYHLFRLGQKLTIASASQFFWHVLHLPVEFFTLRYAGDVASRFQLTEQLAHFLSGQLAVNLVNMMMIVFYAALMLQYSLVLTLIGVAAAGLNFAALRYVSRRRVDAGRRLQQDHGKLLATSFGGLQMIETLKAAGAEDDFFARWAGFQAKVLNAEQELGAYTQILATVPLLLASLATVAILAVGGRLVMAGALTLGGLIAVQYLMTSFSEPVDKLVTLGSSLQDLNAGLQRLDDVLRYPVDPVTAAPPRGGEDPAGAPRLDGAARLAGRLELRHVTFGYSRLEPPLIEDFSLTVRPGARVAIVGASGSGKSTVARLVCGLYQPWSGEILFDGRPREAHPRLVMAGSLAMVDQDIFLFEGTVRENVTLWDATIPEATMVRAARDAYIHEDVAARQNGYEGHVVEGGANFSGGQRQRLEIARALAGDPALLVLDEATSALDAATEKRIDDQLRRRGCTCLVVAHRLSTVRDCDEIVVLDRGKVVQRGTHDELWALGGAYAALIATE